MLELLEILHANPLKKMYSNPLRKYCVPTSLENIACQPPEKNVFKPPKKILYTNLF